jgi:hypothetical protein
MSVVGSDAAGGTPLDRPDVGIMVHGAHSVPSEGGGVLLVSTPPPVRIVEPAS